MANAAPTCCWVWLGVRASANVNNEHETRPCNNDVSFVSSLHRCYSGLPRVLTGLVLFDCGLTSMGAAAACSDRFIVLVTTCAVQHEENQYYAWVAISCVGGCVVFFTSSYAGNERGRSEGVSRVPPHPRRGARAHHARAHCRQAEGSERGTYDAVLLARLVFGALRGVPRCYYGHLETRRRECAYMRETHTDVTVVYSRLGIFFPKPFTNPPRRNCFVRGSPPRAISIS